MQTHTNKLTEHNTQTLDILCADPTSKTQVNVVSGFSHINRIVTVFIFHFSVKTQQNAQLCTHSKMWCQALQEKERLSASE